MDAAGQPGSARSAIHPCLPGLSRSQFRRSGLATRAVDNIRDPTQRGECDEGQFSGSGGVCARLGGRLLVRACCSSMRAPSDPLGGGDPVSDGALLVPGADPPALLNHLHIRLVPRPAHGPRRAGSSQNFNRPLFLLQEELCRNFTIGSISTQTFFSPAYPRNYPRDISCTK